MPRKPKERINERDNVLLECGHVSFGYGLQKVLGKIGVLYTTCPHNCEGEKDGPVKGLVRIKRKAKPGDYPSPAAGGHSEPSPDTLF